MLFYYSFAFKSFNESAVTEGLRRCHDAPCIVNDGRPKFFFSRKVTFVVFAILNHMSTMYIKVIIHGTKLVGPQCSSQWAFRARVVCLWRCLSSISTNQRSNSYLVQFSQKEWKLADGQGDATPVCVLGIVELSEQTADFSRWPLAIYNAIFDGSWIFDPVCSYFRETSSFQLNKSIPRIIWLPAEWKLSQRVSCSILRIMTHCFPILIK